MVSLSQRGTCTPYKAPVSLAHHIQIFRTVPFAHTLVRRVDKNAFAVILPARPCPVFGRPIRPWGRPLDYGPVLLLKPFRFHLAVDTLPSGCLATMSRLSACLGCFRRFQLGARLDLCLSVHPGRRGTTPVFGYGTPYPGASGI